MMNPDEKLLWMARLAKSAPYLAPTFVDYVEQEYAQEARAIDRLVGTTTLACVQDPAELAKRRTKFRQAMERMDATARQARSLAREPADDIFHENVVALAEAEAIEATEKVVSLVRKEAARLVPLIAVTPLALDFQTVEIGRMSGVRFITITNTGTAPLTLGNIISSNNEFTIVGQNPSGQTIPVEGSLLCQLTCTPKQEGRCKAILEIPSDAANATEPVTVNLVARGAAPHIEVEPKDWDFGEVRVIKGKEPRIVTIKNTGLVPLTLGAIVLDAPEHFTIIDDPSGKVIGSLATLDFSIVCTPQLEGPLSCLVTIPSNAPETAPTVKLSCKGTAPRIKIDPDSYDFGGWAANEVPQNGRDKHLFTITSCGTAPLEIAGINLPPGNDFALTCPCALPTLLPIGATLTFEVNFTPAGACLAKSQVQIFSDAINEPALTVGVNAATFDVQALAITLDSKRQPGPDGARMIVYEVIDPGAIFLNGNGVLEVVPQAPAHAAAIFTCALTDDQRRNGNCTILWPQVPFVPAFPPIGYVVDYTLRMIAHGNGVPDPITLEAAFKVVDVVTKQNDLNAVKTQQTALKADLTNALNSAHHKPAQLQAWVNAMNQALTQGDYQTVLGLLPSVSALVADVLDYDTRFASVEARASQLPQTGPDAGMYSYMDGAITEYKTKSWADQRKNDGLVKFEAKLVQYQHTLATRALGPQLLQAATAENRLADNGTIIERKALNSFPPAEQNCIQAVFTAIPLAAGPPAGWGAYTPKWGDNYGNYQGKLPAGGGYMEYYVHPGAGVTGAGTRRLLRKPGSQRWYYSNTHYGETGGGPAFWILT
jgi:guanyl-specific ribonuclease Sa